MTIYKALLAELDLDELKDIPNYPRYKADLRNGRVWDTLKNEWKKFSPNKLGYCYVHLTDNKGNSGSIGVHVVIMMAALEGFDYRKLNLELDHKNGDKSDNRFENLELVTRTENLRRRKNVKTKKFMTKEELDELRNDFKNECLKFGQVMDWYAEKADYYDVSVNTIQTNILGYYNK